VFALILFGQQERFHQCIGANCILCRTNNTYIGEASPVAPLGEEKLTSSTIFYKISTFKCLQHQYIGARRSRQYTRLSLSLLFKPTKNCKHENVENLVF
jgi:hypothetical protein